MKKIQFLLCLGLLAFLFYSCDSEEGGGSGTVTKPTNVPPRMFWAQNTETNAFYQLTADLLAESQNCKVWVERGSGVNDDVAASMARAYESKILQKMLNTFSIKQPYYENGVLLGKNTMELADYIGDGDKKLSILLLDIKDGFSPGVNDSYVAGYFSYWNFTDNQCSNLCDMIYIDTYPSIPGSEASNGTFAHEMQHMMNFVSSALYRSTSSSMYSMDTWIDEGLASAAEWLYHGKQVENKIDTYNSDYSGLVQLGNNFFVWDNWSNISPYALLDDYSTVYLFFQWLRLQAGTSNVYYDIITSSNYDYRAITSVASKYMSGQNYSDWGTLIKTWLAANYINASSGPYGYKGDGALRNIHAKTMPSGYNNVSLAPGEGVYSVTNNFAMPSGKQNIRYAGLNRSGNVSDTETFPGGALLTYNANSNNNGGTESGITTGIAASHEMADVELSRSAAGNNFKGPFAIDARDMLRRNGFESEPLPDLSGLKGGFKVFNE